MLSRTARSSFARPSASAAWLHGPARPVPRTRPVSSPISAVVPDLPPSTPKKSLIGESQIVALVKKEGGRACARPPKTESKTSAFFEGRNFDTQIIGDRPEAQSDCRGTHAGHLL